MIRKKRAKEKTRNRTKKYLSLTPTKNNKLKHVSVINTAVPRSGWTTSRQQNKAIKKTGIRNRL